MADIAIRLLLSSDRLPKKQLQARNANGNKPNRRPPRVLLQRTSLAEHPAPHPTSGMMSPCNQPFDRSSARRPAMSQCPPTEPEVLAEPTTKAEWFGAELTSAQTPAPRHGTRQPGEWGDATPHECARSCHAMPFHSIPGFPLIRQQSSHVKWRKMPPLISSRVILTPPLPAKRKRHPRCPPRRLPPQQRIAQLLRAATPSIPEHTDHTASTVCTSPAKLHTDRMPQLCFLLPARLPSSYHGVLAVWLRK
nr:unnamed protein product [Digitaria exilis]